jgi:beta-mannosidase
MLTTRALARGILQGFIHLTQLSQAEALMYGYRGWRKQWGNKRFCGGALVWQLNDCWPVTSWSIVDYYMRKKPAYYAMRRVLAPTAVAVKRAHWDWSVAHARPAREAAWECWVASREEDVGVRGRVEIRFVSVATGEDIKQKLVREVEIVPNGTTVVVDGVIDNDVEEPHVLAARLWVGDKLVARDCDWPQPLKYLDFADRGVSVIVDDGERGKMRIAAKRPTKGLVFEEREGVLVDDSALDIVQNGDAPLGWRYLGMEPKG